MTDVRWAAAIVADIELVRSFLRRYENDSPTNASKAARRMKKLQAKTNAWYNKYPMLRPHRGRVLPGRLYLTLCYYRDMIKGIPK